MPAEEEDLEKGRGGVATAGTALSNDVPEADLVWESKRIRLTMETGYRIRQHFHFVGQYYWLPRDVMTAVGYETYSNDLARINFALGQLVVNNTLLGVCVFLLHVCLWTLVGVGVQYHWDTSMPGVVAVIAIMSIGLAASTGGIVYAAVDCTDSIVFHDTMERLQQVIIPHMNNAHAPVPPGGPIVAWKWEMEGDLTIIPRKSNEVLKSSVKQHLLRNIHLKLSWATRRRANANAHNSEDGGSDGVSIAVGDLEGQLSAAVTTEEVMAALDDYERCAQSADFAALSNEEKQHTMTDFKSEIGQGRDLAPEVWTTAALLRAGTVYRQLDRSSGDHANYYVDALRIAGTTEELLRCIEQFREVFVSAEFPTLLQGTQRRILSDMKAAAITARSRVTSEVWTPAVVQAYAAALGAANAVVPRLPYAAL